MKITKNVEFEFLNFCPIKIDISGNTFWPQALGFQKLAKMNIFGIFNELLSTHYVNVVHFARNVEWDSVILNQFSMSQNREKTNDE